MPVSPASLSDDALSHALRTFAGRERSTTVEFIRHIAEFDKRRLWAPAGFPSMHEYCVRELHLSDAAAFKRIRAARLSRRFPQVLAMLADGRLHLSALVALSKQLIESNAEELLALAAHKTRDEVELLIATRFPRPDVRTSLRPLMTAAPGPVAVDASPDTLQLLSPGRVDAMPSTCPAAPAVPAPAIEPDTRARVIVPLAPERFALQVTIALTTRDKLRRAQELLGFAVGPNDIAGVLDRALDVLLERLEKQRCAATERPRAMTGATGDARRVPAHVPRAVWQRDRGQCTFVSDAGHRCTERKALELDHVIPVARGGESSVDNLRLRCRAHNQLEAERVFGVEFMASRREAAALSDGRVVH